MGLRILGHAARLQQVTRLVVDMGHYTCASTQICPRKKEEKKAAIFCCWVYETRPRVIFGYCSELARIGSIQYLIHDDLLLLVLVLYGLISEFESPLVMSRPLFESAFHLSTKH